MEQDSENLQVSRPRGHENVSENLLIYALPGWHSSPGAESPAEESAKVPSSGEKWFLPWVLLIFVGTWGLMGLTDSVIGEKFEKMKAYFLLPNTETR